MTDIVERLRAPVSNPEDYADVHDPVRLQAADEIERLRTERNILHGENNMLRAALEPFARYADKLEDWVVDGRFIDCEFAAGDLRRAAAALNKDGVT